MRTCNSKFPKIVLALAALAAVATVPAQNIDTRVLEGMEWREIGPFRGGRAVAVSGVYGDPEKYFIGFCGGGLWRSTDTGENWENVSDGYFKTGSVGAIGVSKSDPDTIYVGMGETELRGNVSHGDGVYKSTDGGDTWTHIGLKETRQISRVRVHPTDSNIVWVAALGHIYGPNPERGIFKTTDGGKSWKNVLFESQRAGAVDISVDANNPDILYAATWESWRTGYGLNSGGPGSKLWKSTDAGESWSDISKNQGLPKETFGKIGVAVSGADSNRVYAIIEALDGGIFRSDDGGDTWEVINESRNYRQRAFYYTRIYADPVDKDKVFVLNTGFYRSTDGGESFRGISVPHGDNHDLWINPEDTENMINANDGGGNVSIDNGSSWSAQDFATAQFYHVITDNFFPYRIYGAQQDNSTVRIASRAAGGITSEHWESTAGGESGYIAIKPDDPEIVFGGSYSGFLTMRNHRTGLSRNVNAWPDNPMGHGAIDLVQRFQWTFPILFSPHDPDVLYTCSQFVLRSTDMGGSWEKISPDLTKSDPSTLQSSGGPITQDNTGVEYYATVFTLAESPIKPGLFWAGSDDGLVHVSRNGGRKWDKITPEGAPEWGLISMIDASNFKEGKAYLALDNHETDDYSPYIYITENYGRTWRMAVNGIDPETFVRVVREDPVREGVLYAGTETGVYVSLDDGENWSPLQMNLPVVPIHDLTIKDGDLIAATHGRSFWVLDDLSPIRGAKGANLNRPTFFAPRDTSRARAGFGGGRRRGGGGQTEPENPRGTTIGSGIFLNYYLPEDVDDVEFEFVDPSGNIVATRSGSESAGANRAVQSRLTYPSYTSVRGMLFWGAGASPIPAPPGIYRVRMKVDGEVVADHPFKLLKDPRSPATNADLVDQYRLAKRIAARTDDANEAVLKVRSIREQVEALVEEHDSLRRDAARLMVQFERVENEIYQTKAQAGQDLLNYPIKLNNRIAALLGTVAGSEYGPTKQSYDVFNMLDKLLEVQLDKLKALIVRDLVDFNRKVEDLGGKAVVPVGFED